MAAAPTSRFASLPVGLPSPGEDLSRRSQSHSIGVAVATVPHLEFERDIVEIQGQIEKLLDLAEDRGVDVSADLEALRGKLEALKEDTYNNLRPIEQVQVARHPRRPYTLDYIERIFTDWMELHGDRAFRDDEAIVGGWARLGGRSIMVVGHQKGRDMKENLRRNFGMPHPEGYRKALRLFRLAEKFGRPVVTFIDTPGAYPGIGAEERGQAEAIAMNLREMARLRVPLISVVIGEGGSGGALALGVTDRILMLEHSIYSVISPEGCAAILWRSAEHREKAADALKITSSNLLTLGVADEVIDEPRGGAHSDWDATARSVEEALDRHLAELTALEPEERIRRRQGKYEAMGRWASEDGLPEG
ncbi:MAG: acetyl-CoA carboxylase carboxyltransferase subunit alpha [Gemmatimonadetes bacterium]|nr:acetyl-CoA carboxylase carboxyltransferase subunit alpha [Gemmatimonadota bacterium]NNK61977.1 acetyl-CoA carboxylase carboxyltransferase subunit alpha [Gemmatimonadota bacterium]